MSVLAAVLFTAILLTVFGLYGWAQNPRRKGSTRRQREEAERLYALDVDGDQG